MTPALSHGGKQGRNGGRELWHFEERGRGRWYKEQHARFGECVAGVVR